MTVLASGKLTPFCALLLICAHAGNSANADFQISGKVQGEGRNDRIISINEATIAAYRHGKTVGFGKSNETGDFSIIVKGSEPVDHVIIEKKKANWHPWVARSVTSAAGDLRLSVLLLPDFGPETFDQYIEQLLAYEDLYYLCAGESRNEDRGDRAEALGDIYGPVLARMPPPEKLAGATERQVFIASKKKSEVSQLYGIGSLSEWVTVYDPGENGASTSALVTLGAKQGWYRVPLSDGYHYGHITDLVRQRDGERLTRISGRWHIGDAMGNFSWDVAADGRFSGTWDRGGAKHRWSGVRSSSLPNE